MAEKRMFAKTIIDTDLFMDMPLSAQALYFHLSMRGDDEGFVDSPKKIRNMIGASDDDMKVLVAKQFIIPFESGVIVIRHWKMHNVIRGDRLKSTVYTEEAAQLTTDKNGVYSKVAGGCLPSDGQVTVKCLTSGGQATVKRQASDCQVSGECLTNDGIDKISIDIDKISLDKNRVGKKKKNNKADFSKLLEESGLSDDVKSACLAFAEAREEMKAPLTGAGFRLMLAKLRELAKTEAEMVDILNQSIINGWKGVFPLEHKTQKAPQTVQSKVAADLEASYEMMARWAGGDGESDGEGEGRAV